MTIPVAAEESASSPLPALTIEAGAISVMGVSSGGYMATQLAVAWPERFSGLASFAAGPWGCAQGALSRAITQCMETRLGLPDLAELERRYAQYLDNGRVGDSAALAEQRVYLWHGGDDEVIDPRLGELLAEQYRDWLTNPETQLAVERTPTAVHGWPVSAAQNSNTDTVGCTEGGSPHLLDCGVDGADEALQWLYGTRMEPPEGEGRGKLMRFDQTRYYDGRRLADEGYVFVPKACEEGASCGLSVVLHGCRMSAGQVGEAFVRYSGLNEWAAQNRLVVLYPQAEPSLPNPQACWDWWGYDESSWQRDPVHDSRQGKQVQAIKAMVDQIASSGT
ncbi:poly(3-hydroxybutyrate) depolymerase [Halomonas sp. McH1-25]|uniref:extracellular catalytic domain type 2 short-chain-length polyhydroxyalkanoate depolymerase n=1 Tax=unclassified Halomonas TaxID=2609666 RepID=UPI001EF44AE0|nr:poly(3-hydroxybutyrate) depolymerase [Halomonas sp. McH1-25]MCP1343882.1 poly(3-hydroxybutyrate) depolymerase [Halomonas sp. FL8]MCP1362011.1 poly(3-hydroxybutyrate) depolymerase [Halomonas sp. BBD45]